jgi:mono/diheme cytochrome c family protein
MMPTGVTPTMLALGDSLFAAGSCQRCHGVAGVGGQNGPPLTTGPWLQADGTYEGIVQVITNGVPQNKLKDSARRPMRGRGGPMNLTDEQVRSVAGYVYSISRSKR